MGSQEILCELDFLYVPVWEVHKNFTFSYLCEPVWSDDQRGDLREEQIRLKFDTPSKSLLLDVEAIHATNEEIQKVARHDILIRFTVPVHYATLADEKSAKRYREECEATLKFWIGCIVFEIVGLPSSPTDLPAIMKRLALYGDVSFLRTGLSFQDMEGLAELGVQSVGLNLRGDDRSEEEMMKDLDSFVLRARAASLQTHIYGLKTISLSIAAVTSGFNFVCSDAISSSLEGMGMDSFLINPKDLFMSYLKGMSGNLEEES